MKNPYIKYAIIFWLAFFAVMLLSCNAYAQSNPKDLKIGGFRPQDTSHIVHHFRFDSSMMAGYYSNSDTSVFLAVDPNGNVVNRKLPITLIGGTVTSITAGAGLNGGVIVSAGTISMPNVGTAGTYGSGTQVPVITTDAQGRVSGVTNTTITGAPPSGSASGDLAGSYPGPTIASGAVTLAKMANISGSGKIIGRYTSGAGVPQELTLSTGLAVDGSGNITATGLGGTVTSVGLVAPSVFSVTGTPVTGSGTLTFAFNGGQTQNMVLASPNGSSGAVGLRAIVSADIPTLNQNTTGTSSNITGVATEIHGGTNQNSYATGDILYASATNTLSKLTGNATTGKTFLSQTGNGSISAAPGWGLLVPGDIPNISATYSLQAGNTNLVTAGTIATGTWNASIIAPLYGGNGVANSNAATVTSSGNFAYTRTLSATTNATFPSGTVILGALGTQQTWTAGNAGAFATLTDASTISVDLSLGNNLGKIVLSGNRTLGVPTNIVQGQSGTMVFDQDITGTRTLTPSWIYGGSGGTAISLSTGALSHDVVSYFVDYYLSANATMTIASPCVVTQTGHGMAVGSCRMVQFTTTGALPTGVSASTTYFATIVDANTYKLSTTFANAQSSTFVNSSGSQSGTHTGVMGLITLTILKDSRH